MWHDNHEAAWVARARRGDAEAYTCLIRQHQDRVYRLALRMVGPDDAEDVAQQACLRAWLGLTTFEAKASFGTWLYRLAINACLDHLRSQRRFRPLPLEDADALADLDVAEQVEAALERREREQALAWALDQLPTEDRLLLHLRSTDNLTYAEIADVLAVRPGTVGSRLYRARARLHALVVSRLGEMVHDLS